jgi:hypothetical protein
LVHKKICSGQVWTWIVVAWNPVICWCKNRISIQQSDNLIKSHVFKLVDDGTEKRIHSWPGIFWSEGLLTVLDLLLNLTCISVCVLFILNDLFQFLRCKLGRWAHILAILKLIRILWYSQSRNHWYEYV